MKYILIISLILSMFTSLSAKKISAQDAAKYTQTAYFAGGCFWGVEYYMEKLEGVGEVDSGYMGGRTKNPTYKDVSYKNTGHYEVVRVKYDPKATTYEKVARRFFEIHNPTQGNGQGPDIGEQYKSAVFYNDESEKETTEKLIKILRKIGYNVKTIVRPAAEFYIAEDYHQDYYTRHRKSPYCHSYVKRFDK